MTWILCQRVIRKSREKTRFFEIEKDFVCKILRRGVQKEKLCAKNDFVFEKSCLVSHRRLQYNEKRRSDFDVREEVFMMNVIFGIVVTAMVIMGLLDSGIAINVYLE